MASKKAKPADERPRNEDAEDESSRSGGGSSKARDTLLQSIRDQVRNTYERIDPVQQRFRFRSRPTTAEIFSKPLIVLLGNHSSGKSTFVNYILKQHASPDKPLGEDVQKTGVAPLDDGFTFISYGQSADEQAGPAIVSNSNLPFSSLSRFGPSFVNHLRLKLRPVPVLRDVLLVDSPGLIDSATEGADRGYDFVKAVRWFAERADFVLMFFDPEKPGTTHESLHVFTNSLQGIEHKLLIVFNKVDKFANIQDFSRAYGALCWNLRSVMAQKDLPFIYCTYVPVGAARDPDATAQRSWSLKEFAQAREEIIDKVINAPSRHMDNLITELRRYAEGLLIHARVISAARSQLWWYRARLLVSLLLLLIVAGLAIAGAHAARLGLLPLGSLLPYPYSFALLTPLLLAGWFLLGQLVVARERQLLPQLNRFFEHSHELELLGHDQREELQRIWTQQEPATRSCIDRFGLLSFPALRNVEAALLEDVMQKITTQLLTTVHKQITRPKAD